MTKDVPANAVVAGNPARVFRYLDSKEPGEMNSQVNTDVYMQEYTRDDIIAKYISDSAGDGIAYILHHVYAPRTCVRSEN